MKKLFRSPFFIRLKHWEYWNSTLVYAPIFPYWLWLSLKARSFYFLTAANPRIKNGGFIMERKSDVYDLLPQQYYPATIRFEPGCELKIIQLAMYDKGISYPLIVKPDIGERGLGVKKINTEAALVAYVQTMPVAFLVQAYVPYEKEIGIFYCKLPGTPTGFISGIVNKEPVTVTGNGVSSLRALVKNNDRYLLQLPAIEAMHGQTMDTILATGKQLILVPYGNHSRGSKFTDETFRVTTNLTTTIDRICNQIPEFYYGRLDIMFKNWEALERGEDFSIVEVNGSGSEPTHIYDPKHSIFFAWREILKHWQMLYAISDANNKKGVPYITMAEGRRERMAFKAIDALLSAKTW